MILQGGKLYYDTPVGILCLDSQFPKPRGHLRNPLTYPFPTVQYLIRGVDVPRMLFNPTPELIEPFLEGARELERQGVLAIAGSAIGLGNVWKFPYITGQNGGGAFVLVYLFCIFLLGMPIMLCEMAIGRKTR